MLTTSMVNRNVAEGGDYTYLPSGGAIYLDRAEGEIVDCELLENVVRGGEYANAGTAPHPRPCVPSPLRRRKSVRRPMHSNGYMQVPCVLIGRD